MTRVGPTADGAAAGLTLLFDGDDTLWPNNHIFETAIERFVRVVGGGAWTDDAVRDELDRVEEAAWSVRGGGTNAFRHNLEETARAIVEPARLPVVVDALDAIVREMPITEAEPLPGVEATLDVLGTRHVLGLVTRGDPAEQWAKIDASGLRGRFRHIEVVRDKDEATYRRLVARVGARRGPDVDDRQLAAVRHRAGARRGPGRGPHPERLDLAARARRPRPRRRADRAPGIIRGPHPPVLTGRSAWTRGTGRGSTARAGIRGSG